MTKVVTYTIKQARPSDDEIEGVLEAYEEARTDEPHHNGMMQLSQELAAANRRIAELEAQLRGGGV
ncbi:hypothetical protein KU75_16085 [Pectobacterium odoriferum]|uniref:Uncharacterized protein n=1 Tax=Pectobacterium odoriferum TaxID=78398 RepID=A0ABR4VN16_9GAMM|nr:hypothetical protein [Pectobacterium odoriferum]KGA40738.1 hypothetical protein KU75_16085 [Pectobacterium odoriferum]